MRVSGVSLSEDLLSWKTKCLGTTTQLQRERGRGKKGGKDLTEVFHFHNVWAVETLEQ